MVEEKKRGLKLQMIRYDVSGGGDILRKENSIGRFIFKQKKLSLLPVNAKLMCHKSTPIHCQELL